MKKKQAETKSLFGMEIQEFPEAHELSIALGMVGMEVGIHGAELVRRGVEAMNKMKGKFDLRTAANIRAQVNKQFEAIADKHARQGKPRITTEDKP